MKLDQRIKTLEQVIGTRTNRPESQLPDDFVKFQEIVGLPLHPFTFQPMKLMPYQNEFIKKIPLKQQKKFHVNKSRQIGFTELILRVLQYHSFHKYAGGKILIIAGTREKTAAKIMHRFKILFKNIEWAVKNNSDRLILELINGTIIEALPSTSTSIRGDTKIKAIFVDETAHFKLIDDSIVMDAIEPIVFTNKSDLFLISTPNGRRGFFYEISRDENDYTKLVYSYEHAIGYIYTQEEIENELERKDIDVEQEYMNQYTTTRMSIFGNDFSYDPGLQAEDYESI